MKFIWEAVITDHSDFGRIHFRQFHSTEQKAAIAGQNALEEARASDPEYAMSYELRVNKREVF